MVLPFAGEDPGEYTGDFLIAVLDHDLAVVLDVEGKGTHIWAGARES